MRRSAGDDMPKANTNASDGGGAGLQWAIDVRLLTHPPMAFGLARAFALAGLLMWALLAFLLAMQGAYDVIWTMALLTAATLGGVMTLGVVAALLLYRNRLHMAFALDPDGATAALRDARVRRVNRLAIVLGMLFGKPGAVGAGLIGETTSTTRVAWRSVARVRAYPRWHTLALANRWRTTMLVICPPDLYEDVERYIDAARRARPCAARANPVPGLLARSALIVAASVPLFHLPVRIDLFTPFLVVCFALAALWLIPVLAWVTLAGLVWIAGEATLAASAPFRSLFTGKMTPRYAIFSGDDYAMLALAALGAGVLTFLSVRLLQGRTPTALADDMMEMDDE